MTTLPQTVIACQVLRLEIEAAAGPEIRLRFLDAALHRFPHKMPQRLAEEIALAEAEGPTEIIMGYGLCGRGVAGLSAERGLRLPRCHDCVGIVLGSPQRYLEVFHQHTGAFFMFPGLIAAEFDPLTTLEREYIPRLGPKRAKRGLDLALEKYTHMAFIDNGLTGDTSYLARFEENCRAFGKEPLALKGDLSYIRALIHGPRQPGDFVELAGGVEVDPMSFY